MSNGGGHGKDHEEEYRDHALPDWVSLVPESEPESRHYLYYEAQVLVAEADWDLIKDRFDEGTQPTRGETKDGLTLVTLPPPPDGPKHDPAYLPRLVERLREPVTENGVTRTPGAFPHIVVGLQWHGTVGPHGPPKPARALEDLPGRGVLPLAGDGVTIGVVDTGFSPGDPKWFQGRASGDAEPVVVEADGQLAWACGHGTHIAGTILRHAPGATVVVRAVATSRRTGSGDPREQGVFTDLEVADAIDELAKTKIDILSFSGGAPTHEGSGLPATERALKRLQAAQPNVAIVAAAGNDDTMAEHYPAASEGVYAVAAHDASGGRAKFSNHGTWIDFCALGVDVHAPFIRAEPTAVAPDPPFSRAPFFAEWDGTSFATPIVAAAIAAEYSPPGLPGLLLRVLRPLSGPKTAREAADRLKAAGAPQPDLGVVLRPTAYARPKP